ncbi:MAG TPA: FAD-dependent monooxygenase [Stellaceae bacterium]|nr:FAD-dependent monooxygenase [Stellaceae bacterium]
MTDRPRALVIGGSVGGLMAACLLRQIGWDVAVFEKTPGDLAGRGAGLGLSSELFGVMRRVGVHLHPSTGVAVSSLLWIDRSGGVVSRLPRPWITGAWSRIYRPLREAVPDGIVQPGRTVARVEAEGHGLALRFADGTRTAGDLVIGADGVHSTTRRQFLPEIEPRYAGYIAWRGMVEEATLTQDARALLGDSIAFTFPEGEMTLSTPIPGFGDDTRDGHRRYYFIWYRPTDAVAELMTDEAGRNHFPAIPPTAIRASVIAAMKEDARALLPPVLAEIVGRAEQPLLQAVSDLEVPRLVFGRTALLGDAAFIARPHVAAGITKAALDAAALADALAAEGDVPRALARYERERLGFGTALVAYSRALGAASLAPAATRDPQRLMREYGAPHLLKDAGAADISS